MLNILKYRWRTLLATLVGVIVGVVAGRSGLHPGAACLVGWNIGCVAFLAPTGWMLLHDEEETVRARAAQEDENRGVLMGLILGAVLFSFAAIIVALRESKGMHGGGADALAALSISTLVLSWLVVQSLFTLHYAHRYFVDADADGHTDRGVQFQGEQPCSYRDFIYMAVCMGATFQVSDFSLTTSRFRNLVTVHAMVAFAFNTLVLALGINIVGNLLGQ